VPDPHLPARLTTSASYTILLIPRRSISSSLSLHYRSRSDERPSSSSTMSAPSGIKVPPSLTSAFGSAQSNGDDVRALVFTIEGGE
jgi:hypothetical protein